MKKWCLAIAAVLLLSLCGTSFCALAEPTEISPEIQAMLPALDSVMRASGYEEAVYDPRDPEFFWYSLYLMAVNWGSQHPLATMDEETYDLMLPRKAVQELATALFEDYDDLLPVPESMSASAIYDDSLDAFRFPMSDAGDSYTEIEGIINSDDGPLMVYAVMKSASENDEVIQRMCFVLAPNIYAGGIAHPTYLYSISQATPGAQ